MTFVPFKSVLAAAALAAFSLAPAQADVLLGYDFTADSLAPTASATGVSGSAITGGAGLTDGGFSTGGFGYSTAPVLQAVPNGFTTAADAVAGDSYFAFSVTPGSEALDLESLTFDAARGGGGTPRGYDVRSSLDNFASSLGTSALGTARPTFDDYTVNLNTASFAAIDSPVEFRVYVFSPNANNSIEFDNFVLNGTVGAAVPEPASLALLGLGGVALLGRRRGA